ncbi:MAG: putative aconitase with swiveling domain [Rhodothermales bacterium]|jgi:predicted aconitase with swiveling domain
MARVISGDLVVSGSASGITLVSMEPLSFWGGYDQKTGEIIDRRHPLSGEMSAGRILVLPYTRGSSTSTAILLESVRAGVAPAGLVTDRPDLFLALASVVADEMYQKSFPILAVSRQEFETIQTGLEARITADGQLILGG